MPSWRETFCAKPEHCKLFCLVPKMLLHRPRNTGSLGRDRVGAACCEIPTRPVDTVDPRSERVFVTSQSRSTKNTRSRSHSKGSGRPEQSAEGASIKSPSGFDWSFPCAQEFGNVGCIAEQTPTGTDFRHPTGGAGFSTTVSIAVGPKVVRKVFA